MTPARLRWGLLLIMSGILILLVKTDAMSLGLWTFIVTFFPVFLIAVGIEKIFTRSKYQTIAYAAPVILVAAGFAIAFTGDEFSIDSGFIESKTIIESDDTDVDFLQAVVDVGEGDLTIRDATDYLWTGKFREFSSKPEYTLERTGDSARVTLATTTGRIWGGVVKIETDEPNDWHLAFSRSIPLGLQCVGDQSDIHLNLATTPLERLDVDADNSDIYIKLGKIIPDITVSVAGLDSKLRLRVPQETGLRVTGIEDPAYLYEIGLLKRDDSFVTNGFDTLSNRIKVNLDDRFRSLSIDFY